MYQSIVAGEILVIAIVYWARQGQLGLFLQATRGGATLPS